MAPTRRPEVQRAARAPSRFSAFHPLRGPLPRTITIAHGTEITPKALDEWDFRSCAIPDFTRPGQPVEHALRENFNGRLRGNSLDAYALESVTQAPALPTAWQVDYNRARR